jgi:DNA-binding transcriptional LysR family regulator
VKGLFSQENNHALMRPSLENLTSMALFAHVVRHRSFTAAAREAGLAKSAVSRRVAELEARLGVRLLARTTRKLSLTEEGVRYYEHCAALLAVAGAAEEAAAGASKELRGRLRVNAPVTFAQMFLAGPIADFASRYPAVDVELTADDRFVDVIEGGFDVVVRVTGKLADSSLVARKLATDRLVICGSPAYLAERGRPASPADLIDHHCLHYTLVTREAEWRFRKPDGRPFVAPALGSFASSDGMVLRAAALRGLGLAVLPEMLVAGDVRAGHLELVLEGTRRAPFVIYAVVAAKQNLPARTKRLLDHLATHFGRADWRTAALVPA